ncbi:hypothetical protein B481_0359 [Planococcus halocryophilus Or1]|uniref:Zinc-finger domain-containing protein n=1 Tax=Planococcus halocryophilus TaxID=1215089 RepID=A0A1C7DNQ7_9BACL|nr:hypothetical protein [Planococcus halocryophilus]ANU13032.1 hypothetical protein BBI08_03865 [Planococcus halocryophilus]EMF47825.1 hypothetical protein B481_0359 [Planococcus halocryophilus Or1]
MECDFLLSYINGSQLMKKEYAEVVEHHLAICLTCQELFEIMGDFPSIEEEGSFSIEMKARILTKVFDEEFPML